MASSSTSSVQKSFKYDIFLSFRGDDTRKTFVDHLYHALQQKSIHTYKDDQRIKKGERISDELMKSIEDSRFYIIIFSKNYASSSWCLDELVKIMECQKTTEHTAYPVFYDVEPTEVRKQSGEFGKGFAKYEKEEAAEKWRKALEEASNLAGWEPKNTLDGHEAQIIKKIVEEVSVELHSINVSINENLVGMKTRIKDVVSSLEMGFDDVRMLGIKGMGGGGKTTLARAVFDQISNRFEGKSFVENVREIANNSLSGLKSLQEKVLSNVLNDKDYKLDSVHDGKKMMKERMCGRKVLLVLDDVDHIDQLKALAGEFNWFNEGSRIIITTRDEQVLVAHGVQLICDVNLLSDDEAIRLFSKYAFKRESPIQGYTKLSEQVVGYAAGLPLTITVLGSFLCKKSELEWKDAIERLKTIPLKDTLKKLELSYIGLEEEDYKEIFLDVACIMKGWEKEKAIKVLKCCGFHARNGLRVLEQKSLITISGRFFSSDQYLDMHDHIEEMGKNIVRRLHPNEPNRHSRLWIDEEIEDIFANNKGTGATTCIQLETSEVLNPEVVMKGLGNMKNLRCLIVDSNSINFAFTSYRSRLLSIDYEWKFDEVSQYFPNAIRYLSWSWYPFGSLPKTFEANNLVALKMWDGQIVQLWEGGEKKVLTKLKYLDLRSLKLESFDLGLTPNLESLIIISCPLVQLHIPVECLKLKSLNLWCSKLKTLDLRRTPNLEILSLNECDYLIEFRIPVECLSNLRSLNINSHKLRTLDLRGTLYLETLSLRQCDDLVEIHFPVECLKLTSIHLYCNNLKTLDLRGTPYLETLSLRQCDDLVEIHFPVECLKLTSIHLYCNNLKTLALGWTPNLKTLRLGECSNLVELHILVECHLKLGSLYVNHPNLRTLGVGNLDLKALGVCVINDDIFQSLNIPVGCRIKLIFLDLDHSKLITTDLQETLNLETLCFVMCVNHLVEIHTPVEFRLNITSIDLSCSKLRTLDLRGIPNLETLRLVECVDLVELHIPIECRQKLISIDLGSSRLRTLDLRGTPNLETLRLVECVDLVELHMPIECCQKLISIDLGSSKLRTLDLRGALNLEKIRLVECVDLEELHIPIECRLKLISFDLGSSKLKVLDLRGAPNLETLSVRGCYDLVELHIHTECPKLESISIMGAKLSTFDFGWTPNLKKLSLTKCYHLVDVHARDGCLKKLDYIDLSDCLRFNNFFLIRPVESVEVGCASKLHLIAESLDMCPLHFGNNLPKFRFACFYEEHGPSSTGNLEKLISFGLCACTDLERFSQSICGLGFLTKLTLEGRIPESPKELHQLEFLEELHLLSTEITHLPDSICLLKRLKCLELNHCWLLEKLPEDLGRLECLEKLILSECVFLQDIPNNICNMKHLEYFHLRSCVAVVKLPDEFGCLECLKELNIEGTGIRRLPQSIYELKGLRIVAFGWLLQSHGFTSEIKTSKDETEDETFCYVEL